MLRKQKWPRLQNENTMCPSLIEIEDVAGKHRSKASPTNHDVVELLGIGIEASIRASDSFVQAVADITAHHIQGKIRTLRRGTTHKTLLYCGCGSCGWSRLDIYNLRARRKNRVSEFKGGRRGRSVPSFGRKLSA